MSPDQEKRIAQVAADRESGASDILVEAIAILRTALATGDDVDDVARALCRAQPSMAPIWNASIAAVAAADDPARFERWAERVGRAPRALVRFGLECLEIGQTAGTAINLVTISYSGSVLRVIEALELARPVHVACSESRPALEGRRLASRVAAAGIPVTQFSDAAIGHALDSAYAVLVGADAVSADWFLNKSGTRMLITSASQRGIPTYVVASREKFVTEGLARRLDAREGPAVDIWANAPAGIVVRNPYFESTPLELVTGVITDAGVLSAGMIPEVCEALSRETPPELLDRLVRS